MQRLAREKIKIKTDLHRHLGGAISTECIYQLLNGAVSKEEIVRRRTFKEGESRDFYNFLEKFHILNEIQWNERAIATALEQVCWDVAKERINHVELKLSVDKYAQHIGCKPSEVSRLIRRVCDWESYRHDITIALVLCLKYESDRNRQREIASLVEDPDIAECFVGIDLVGDEAYYDADYYADILRPWRDADKGLVAHVGESCSGENVRTAIEKIGVKRVAHGIKSFGDDDILALARERDVCFDIAISSNVCTGVVGDVRDHPVKILLDRGIPFTIGTDDPAVLETNLNQEYTILQETFGLSDNDLLGIMANSVKYRF